ncbi:MAG: hypothetical protein AAFZ80_01945 [Cyanobacteria bacterium P01_A01_bin.105]
MTTTTVLAFMQKTGTDTTLKQQLEHLLGTGDGNISSAAELDANESAALTERAPHVTEFATGQGFDFTTDELIAVVESFQQLQSGAITDDAFAQQVGLASGETLQGTTKNSFQRVTNYLCKTYLGIERN